MQIKNIIAGLALSAALGVSAPVNANDWKTMPGASCQAYFGSQEVNINKQTNGALNTATAYRWISCGITRDNSTNTNGTLGTWVYVNSATGSNSSCYLVSSFPNGNTQQFIVGTAIPTGWISVRPTLSSAFGNYVAYCYVPPQGRISSVLNYEYANTTTQ